MGLHLTFSELERECSTIRSFARRFIDQRTSHQFDMLLSTLVGIKKEGVAGRSYKWQVPHNEPIKTVNSIGHYQPDGNGALTLRAELSFLWEITPLVADRGIRTGRFEVVGVSSTQLNLVDSNEELRACWTVDLGAQDSQGTYFHSHIKPTQARQDDPDIPRLPSHLFSPFQVLEFALGELFQEDWARTATAETEPVRQWSGIQRPRFKKLYQWQLERIEAAMSPTISLKLAKPHSELLVR